MALNKEKLHGLLWSISQLDEKQWLKSAIESTQKGIFDLFVDAKLSVNDKAAISKLHTWLIEKIPTINNFAHKQDLEKEIVVLQQIQDSMNNINTPTSIPKSVLAPWETQSSIEQSAIIKNISNTTLSPAATARVYKVDGDMHRTKVVLNNNNYEIQHSDQTIATLSRKNHQRTLALDEKLMKALGINNIHIPFVLSQTINLPSLKRNRKTIDWSTHIQKQKTWKINLHDREYADTNPDRKETVQSDLNTDNTPNHVKDLISTNKQLVDMLWQQGFVRTNETKESHNDIRDIIHDAQAKTLKKIGKVNKLMDSMKKDIVARMDKQDASLDQVKKDLEKIQELDTKLWSLQIDMNKKFDAMEDYFKSATTEHIEKAKDLMENHIKSIGELLDEKLQANLDSCKELIEKQHGERKDEHDTILQKIEEIEKQRKQTDPISSSAEEQAKTSDIHNTPAETSDDPTHAWEIQIQAHIMDKKSLVKKSIEQDVLEEYQRKYEKRRWPQRLAMYSYARFMQNRHINKRLRNAQWYNGAIETQTNRQQRVSSSIGNFAGEFSLGLDEWTVSKTALADNDVVNSIANEYIKGTKNGWISRDEAVNQFNQFFANNSNYQTGMTGTDIMEQLDETALVVAISSHLWDRTHPRDYRSIQQKVSLIAASNPNLKIHGIKLSNTVSKTEIDKICDYVNAYKIRSSIANLQNITANIKLYKVEKDTVDLTESKIRDQNKNWIDTTLGIFNAGTFGLAGSTRWRVALKMMMGGWMVAWWVGTLWVVWWVAGMAAVLQWIKTYRDYLTEAQKTHEDAMTMGTKELDRRIKELEAQVKKHNIFQKSLSMWWFGKHAIRTKQLNILHAVHDSMHKSGAMKPAIQLIQDLQQSNKDAQWAAIAETLARLKIGRELNTNFISGTTRSVTEQERKQLLLQLRESASERAQKLWYSHIVPSPTADETEWKIFWTNILTLPGSTIETIYQKRCDTLQKDFKTMKKDINKGRARMAFRDTITNLATSATVITGAAWIHAGINAWQWWSVETSASTLQWPHNQYDLGKYETPANDKAEWWEKVFNDGDKISFQWEAAVDAVSATSKTFGVIEEEIAQVTQLAQSFDDTTQAAVKEALTTELAKVKAEAIKAWADAGNITLTQQRWVDGVEEILTKLQAAEKTGVTIENITFDPSTFKSIDIQESVAPWSGVAMQDVIDRSVAFQATIDGVPGTRSPGEPLWIVWPWFSNTYAKPGDASKYDDSWSKGSIEEWSEEAKTKKENKKLDKENEVMKKTIDQYKKDVEKLDQLERLKLKKLEKLQQLEDKQNIVWSYQLDIKTKTEQVADMQQEIDNLESTIKQNNTDLIAIEDHIVDTLKKQNRPVWWRAWFKNKYKINKEIERKKEALKNAEEIYAQTLRDSESIEIDRSKNQLLDTIEKQKDLVKIHIQGIIDSYENKITALEGARWDNIKSDALIDSEINKIRSQIQWYQSRIENI